MNPQTQEALHKALKVLNCLNNNRVYETAWVKGAINACKEAIAQPAQEPVAFDMQSICDKHGITLILDDEHTDNNAGGSAGQDTIMLGRFDDEDLKIVAFFHELGHCLFKPVDSRWMDTLSMEGTAWEVGRQEAAKYGFKWAYDSKEMQWARKQLNSYTHPAPSWQGLSDDDIDAITCVQFEERAQIRAIEQALKEKNHG